MAKLSVRMPEQPRPRFLVEECHEGVPDAMREQIVKTMMWQAQLALYDTVTPGRSLYTLMRFPHGGEQMIVPAKLKGAGGLKRMLVGDEPVSIIVPPEPHLRYGPVRQLHFAMGPDYELHTVLGSEKSKYSCGAAGVRNEYAIQRKAHDHGIAMPPLLRGTFEGETDRLGNPTGAVAIAADHRYQTVGRMDNFQVADADGTPEAFLRMGDKVVQMPLSVMSAIRATTAGMMGETKRKLLVELGIARHAGHEGNFLLRADRKDMLVTDFDSARELSSLDAGVRPFQVLRDAAHDTWRVLSKFAYKFQMQDAALAALADKQANPVHAFLHGFFGKTVDAARIDAEAARLTQRFLAFARERKADIDAHLQDGDGRNNDIAQSLFAKLFYPLFEDCIVSCTALLQADADAQGRGYALPVIAEADLRAKAARGIEGYFAAVDAESDRGKELMRTEGKELADYF